MRPETVDMKDQFARDYLPRYERGAEHYGQTNVLTSPLRKLQEATEECADLAFYLRQAQRDLEPQDGRLRVYIAGPYRGKTSIVVAGNVARARQAQTEVLQRGHSPFSPITMTHQEGTPPVPPEVYIQTDMDWLPFCHVILLLGGWKNSEGAKREHARAVELRLRRIYHASELPFNSPAD